MSDIDTTQSPSSVFYGYFSKYTWRNEKNGNSFFRIVTKQELFFEQRKYILQASCMFRKGI